jgi:hypothetical protein
MVDKSCESCHKTFKVKPSFLNRKGRGRFCNKACYDTWQRRGRVNPNCAQCGNQYERKHYTRSRNKFCSIKCYSQYRQRDALGKYVSGEIKGASHYRKIAFQIHGQCGCSICGYDKVLKILQVHHLDHNRCNNSPENLAVVCPNCHAELEQFIREHQLTPEILNATRPVWKMAGKH